MRNVDKMLVAAVAVIVTVGGSLMAMAEEAASATKPAVSRLRTAGPFWAYQPVASPAVPKVKSAEWVRSPIDAFIAAKLEESGLRPSADADRASYARRAYLDVLGFVPEPEVVRAFVNDRSPNAYETFIDGLLASPHYGERQARRWLDLARYADTQGYQDDEQRPGMWRYRDYVIKAFNEDRPLDRFIREQVAGDELWPDSQDAQVATGFLRSYPDAPDHRDLVQKRYTSITDMADTVGAVFLGHSFECARCHDHKFDKISQKEYFEFQAFFANTVPSDNLRVRGTEERGLRYQKELAAWEDATRQSRAALEQFIAPHWDEVIQYARERFYTDGRASLLKPQAEWKSLDRWLNYRFDQYVARNNLDLPEWYNRLGLAGGAFEEANQRASADPAISQEEKGRQAKRLDTYRELQKALKEFDKLKPDSAATIFSAVTELGFSDAAPQFLYEGGDHLRPLVEVQPAFPAALSAVGTGPQIRPTAYSSGRRAALANWIADARNPLTARVYVNRVWAQYFGRGLVRTVSDFGKAGERPTHPELLDYLADSFVKDGWSVKKLHRRILLSSVYRQSSAFQAKAFEVDPENKLLASFPRRRLDAEQIRDSILAVAGKLNLEIGGPSIYPEMPEAVMQQSTRRVESFWPVSKDEKDRNRRSLYVYTRRSVPFPMLDAFDMASPQAFHSRRDVTTTPQQSLTLFNNALVYEWSRSLAGRIGRDAGSADAARIDRLFEVLYARLPDAAERDLVAQEWARQEQLIVKARQSVPVATKVSHTGQPQLAAAREDAFVNIVHTLLNSNEFVYRY